MEIKIESSLHNLNLKNNGEYRIEVNVPLTNISGAMSMVQLLNKEFNVQFEVEGTIATLKATFHRLIIDKDGESRIMFITNSSEMLGGVSDILGDSIEKIINLTINGE